MIKKPSSCVSDICYNTKSKKLTVFYTNHSKSKTERDGAIYDYFGVPASVYTGILAAESKGKYLNMNVKGIYTYVKRDTSSR